jgi:hypothetical protein
MVQWMRLMIHLFRACRVNNLPRARPHVQGASRDSDLLATFLPRHTSAPSCTARPASSCCPSASNSANLPFRARHSAWVLKHPRVCPCPFITQRISCRASPLICPGCANLYPSRRGLLLQGALHAFVSPPTPKKGPACCPLLTAAMDVPWRVSVLLLQHHTLLQPLIRL